MMKVTAAGAVVSIPTSLRRLASLCPVRSSSTQDSIFGLNDPSPGAGAPVATLAEQEPPRRRWWPHGCVPNGLIALCLMVLLSGHCLDAYTDSNEIHHVPAIHGRAVDMETGQPLAGLTITRWFRRDGILEGYHHRLDRSIVTVTTDAAGRFDLPSWWGILRGISAVEWTEFKPGWVAADGWVSTKTPPSLIASSTTTTSYVTAQTRRERSRNTLILMIHRVNSPRTAEEHFYQLSLLIEKRLTTDESFVSEATSYANSYELNPTILERFMSIRSTWGGYDPQGRPCYRARLAWTLLRLQEAYCKTHPRERLCSLAELSNERAFLETHCGNFRR